MENAELLNYYARSNDLSYPKHMCKCKPNKSRSLASVVILTDADPLNPQQSRASTSMQLVFCYIYSYRPSMQKVIINLVRIRLCFVQCCYLIFKVLLHS